MKRQPRILAGTALGLLMASAPLGAFPLQGSAAFEPLQRTATPLILAQSNCPEGESAEGCPQQGEPEQKPRKKRERQAESAPTEQAAPSGDEQGNQRRKKREQQQQTESAPAEQAAPAEEQKPRRKKRDQQQIEAAPAEQAAPAEEQPRRKKRDQQQQIEAAPAEEPAEQAAPREKAAPANDNEQVTPRRKKRDQDQQIEAAPAEQPARKETPAGEQAEPLPTDQQTAPAEGEKPREQAKERRKKPIDEQPVTGEQPTTGEQPAEDQQAAPAEGEGPAQGEAPVFDSQKDARRKKKGGRDNAQETGGQDAGGQPTQQNGEQAEAPKPAPVDQGPPPTDDRTAQQAIKLERMVPVTEEKGKRVERVPDVEDIRRRPRPQGVDVVRELGDRVILQFNNQTIVESDDTPRMRRGARNVYYEELSGDRTREIVERDNGIQIVTIRNRYGDVIRRSRIAPDGREYVLSYVDERYYEDDGDWRDPGDDLPPIRIDIPREEYILDSEEVEDPDDYYAFLEQPPVERVQRLYSIDEVKRSARVRDIARRIDLDTLNFEFGSASIPETEVQKLEGVASAMEKLLEKNPAETFLIEGHTDAVGRPEANLALSDRRAEAVAEALTNAFNIPPENLTTQGYGEEYLKVDTSEPERENRRVAIRRITSLVAPVASAN
ncbi:OmpA family protein [Mesorhizobium sp.]|uniref:OmpA family protein n=1 Tax=Mesorhizobium sp. TaxID=1871066 RepID=UPI000FE4635C|nr:OmpA family protein [Mesorhizobium sp.]RWK62887.1 MAG: flagellar motor protein MotB [Mesorhizobium sp.]RWM56163.1 MAG: flagellar motor protein MotB [Mesorhizobium sp.]TIO70788.1 MAG: flagellar motor protein MotB [Mesorhizobium sp.]